MAPGSTLRVGRWKGTVTVRTSITSVWLTRLVEGRQATNTSSESYIAIKTLFTVAYTLVQTVRFEHLHEPMNTYTYTPASDSVFASLYTIYNLIALIRLHSNSHAPL